jgi:hypothetical protein
MTMGIARGMEEFSGYRNEMLIRRRRPDGRYAVGLCHYSVTVSSFRVTFIDWRVQNRDARPDRIGGHIACGGTK